MPEPFLHQCKQFGIVRCLGIKDAFGREPRLVQSRREQVAAPHNPEHRPPRSCGDRGHEQGGRRIVAKIGGGGGDLMERIESQAIAGEPRIDRVDSERQHLATRVTIAFDGAQRLAKIGNDVRMGHK